MYLVFRTADSKPVDVNTLERCCSGTWNVHVASRGPGKAARAFSFSLGDEDKAQGLRHARFLHSAPHPGPDTVGEDGREVESLTSKLVARGLILPTNLS